MTTLLPLDSFPTYVDNTMLTAYRSCPRKFYWNYGRNQVSLGHTSVHLVAGGAYAKGLEVARKAFHAEGATPFEALKAGVLALIKEYGDYEPPSDSYKSWENMVLALVEYFDIYKWAEDHIQPHYIGGSPMIECSFALPLDIPHPDTQEPIIYCGRYDMMGVFQDTLWAVDEKTTARLGPSWNKQWALRSQFTGYIWAARQYGIPVGGAIVRGISILKHDFGHAEVISQRSDYMIREWLASTHRTLAQMIIDYREGIWMQNLADSCSSYGGCTYMDLCDKSEPESWLSANYKESKWDPMPPNIIAAGVV